MKFAAYILIITAFFINTLQTLGAEEKEVIRVGLSNSGFSSFEFSETTILTTAQSSLNDMANGAQIKDIPANTTIHIRILNGQYNVTINTKEVLKGAKGPILIVSNGKLGLKNHSRQGSPAYYRGMIELKTTDKNNQKFNIINVLDTQTYLKGVVPKEMPVSFGLNALKAQAIAARNYANRPQNVYKNYDICDSTACQVYYGANGENPLSDRAVDETRGVFALYNKEPILALYSSTAGGITEDYESVYGTFNPLNTTFYNSKPYLKSVKDNNSLEIPKSEEELKKFYSNSVPSFDIKSPKHRWKVDFDRFELEETLSKTLREQSLKSLVYPAFSENDKVWGLEDIKVVKRGASGKAIDVEIHAMSGTWRVKKELGIRRVFKKGKSILWSGNFVVEKNVSEKTAKTLENTLSDTENTKNTGIPENKNPENNNSKAIFTYSKPENEGSIIKNPETSNTEEIKKVYKNRLGMPLPDSFTFIGAGFGHGVGMSQYGAGYLSANGVGYDAILKHYYSGITLGTMPKTVSYNNYNQNYVLNMYVDTLNTTATGGGISLSDKNPLHKELLTLYNVSNQQSKYILNIDNEKRPAGLEFYINDFHFTPDMKGFFGKILKMDITKYLKKGENTITFMPLNAADKDKTVSFWVEIEK